LYTATKPGQSREQLPLQVPDDFGFLGGFPIPKQQSQRIEQPLTRISPGKRRQGGFCPEGPQVQGIITPP